ncbi:ribonuclease I [Acinetobacter tianfuensis]|uniref:Ribonuclease I n=1 Tax=Acinetobacter tianfuensis TaxID=2419603 RepID=A0A3A8ETM3_9GAMM|nr:ribonuclease I [Acinetobacter tianfuensis]RKG32231.1 ribonuclease I [Acinetobacter tianfuensis]
MCCAAGNFVLSAAAHASPHVTGYVMHIQLVPAICSLDAYSSKKRKCLEGYSLNIAGLYPEGFQQRNCTTGSSAVLPPIQTKVVARVMPDENARHQLWRTVGGCVPMQASQYFRTIINFAEKLKVPEELTSQENHIFQSSVLRSKLQRLNPRLSSQSFEFICQQYGSGSILTEMRVCYRSGGQYKACPAYVQNECPGTFTIKGAF